MLAESNLAGAITDEYIFFGGKRMARVDASGKVDYYLGDSIGSARVVTDANGNILDDCDFLPFGAERCVAQSSGNNYQFTGQERDPETGNDHFPARTYENTMGRWLSPDPGHAGAIAANPQTWNAYAYAQDNPTTDTDPDGRGAVDTICSPDGTGCTGGDPRFNWGVDEFDAVGGAAGTSVAIDNYGSWTWSYNPALMAQQQNVNNEAVGNTTVGNLSKVLTNEIGSLSAPKGGDPKELQNGANAIANALINNAHRTRPNEVAPDTGTASPSLAKIMQGAFTNRANGGADPVHGRTFYGTSHISPSRLHSRPIGNGRQTVYQHFGPFNDSYSGRTTWIYIYNDPGH